MSMSTPPSLQAETPSATSLLSQGEDDLVILDPDHPGFRDLQYRQRRNEIARMALGYRDGDPLPKVAYSEAEQEVWRTVWEHLSPLHEQRACREYLACSDLLQLDKQQVPQLAEVSEKLARSSGFRMRPVAGLVTERAFLSRLGEGIFMSTQYMRHPSTPLYTPEPDVVHELIGHAAQLAHPGFAEFNRAFGKASARATDEQVRGIARVYWYTVEFGVVQEEGQPKAFGAGLLSSFGELGRYDRDATLVPLDFERMAATAYEPTRYQDLLFYGDSHHGLLRAVTDWLSRF